MRVAVVGSGVSGLGAAWLLNEHSDHDVHVYEADSRPGGHANTVDYTPPGKNDSIPVDTGFIVLNPVTYPNFLRFLKLKNIPVLPTEMTFSVSRDMGQFEWAGDNLFSVFCQPTRILDPSMWSLIYDVLRFNACSRKILLERGPDEDISIGKYLDINGYSRSFRDNYLIPMTAAVWSTSPDKCSLDFPSRTLIQFMHNHHLLQITGKPPWLTIPGGSKVYVEAITRNLRKGHLHLSSPVCSVKSLPSGKLELRTSTGEVELFDHVILACHSDTALEILKAGNVTSEEQRILGMFSWNRNEAVLHSDTRLMPKRRLAWSCWNYLSSSAIDEQGNFKANIDRVSLTYWMNALQHFPNSSSPILVTLNPPFPPNPSTIRGTYTYSHPILSSSSLTAQSLIHKIQNTRGISYAGAYLRYGFHEDGFTSGLRAASKYLGDVKLPFEIRDSDRAVTYVWLSALFEMIEGSGVRRTLGFVLSCVLYLIRVPVGMFVDLSHLNH